MATHDYVIDNSTGANVRADLNSVLQAILSNNSSSSAPSTTAAYMWWADTTNGVLKIRNSANNAWVELLQLDGTLTLEDGSASTPALAFRDDLNTGIFSSAADTFNVATAGVERMELGATTIFNEDGADVDFRIEGDTDTNLFRLDASVDRIGIGISAPQQKLHIAVSDSGAANIAFTNSTTGSGSGDGLVIGLTGGEDGQINMQESANLKFSTADTERLRIDSVGRVLIGHSSARTNIAGINDPQIQLEGLSSDDSSFSLIRNTNNAFAGSIILGKTRGGSVGSNTIVQNGDDIGNIRFAAADGNDIDTEVAIIKAEIDATPGSNDTPGRLSFHTTPDGSTSPSERVRIDSSGKVGIGTTSPEERLDLGNDVQMNLKIGGRCYIGQAYSTAATILGHSVKAKTTGTTSGGMIVTETNSGGGAPSALRMQSGNIEFHTAASGTADADFNSNERMRIDSSGNVGIGTTTPNDKLEVHGSITQANTSTSNTSSQLFFNNDVSGGAYRVRFDSNNSTVGSIQVNTSSTVYNTSSDYRLKENITAISDGITRLKTLKPSRFNFKVDASTTVDGFIAHEVTAVPEAISGTKDEIATEDSKEAKKGDPIYQQIDQSKLVPLLVAAVQELITKVETLEAA